MLLQYTFESALESGYIDTTILSTDCQSIAGAAYPTAIEVPFIRPSQLAQDHTPTIDVVKHALDFYDHQGLFYENIILLQPTCPFRPPGFIDRCIEHFMQTNADSLVSVIPVPKAFNPHWVFEPDHSNFLKIATGENTIIPSRQLLPPAYARDGSVYVFKASNIRNNHSMYGNSMAYMQSNNIWHVNIDTPEDWQRAELIATMQGSLN